METETDFLITLLQQPELYDHPVDKLELLETHISLVVKTGEYVYKIKKSVDYGFLDFSDLAKRKLSCDEEIRLNNRLAPEIYISVVPICGDKSSAKINGTGPVIEYAVKMRQFDTELEFDKLLANEQLASRHIEETAITLADFHANIAATCEDGPYGSPEVIHHFVYENFTQIALLGDEWLATHDLSAVLESLQEWVDEQHQKIESTLASRKSEGFIRECHGDLHLRNLVVYKGKITPFDGIEFNKELSFIDVMNDIAFLLMDLDDHGRCDLSRLLLNQYLSSTGDYAGLAVLRYYKVYRAMVRAKVAGLRLLQLQNHDDDLVAEIENYLKLALTYTQADKPKMVICHGSSGSGKTYISELLLEQVNIIRIRSDVERKRIIELSVTEEDRSKLSGGIYSEDNSRKTYAYLLNLAKIVLNAGYAVLVDAAFLKQEQRQAYFDYAQSSSVPFVILHCISDSQLQRQRLNERAMLKNDASDADIQVLEYQFDHQELLTTQEKEHCMTINNNANPDIMQLVEWLTGSKQSKSIH